MRVPLLSPQAAVVALCLGLCLLMGAPIMAEAASPDPGDEPIASYRAVVTRAQLHRWLAYRAIAPEDAPPGAIDRVILQFSLAAEAERLGLDRALATRVKLVRAAAAVAKPLLEQHVREQVSITDAEAEAHYQAIKDTYTRPRRVRLYNLYLRYPPDADADAKASTRARMEALQQRLREGVGFQDLARAESDSQTRLRGGLIGNVRQGQLQPAIDAVAMAMAPGEISPILEANDGLTLLYCEQILPAVERTPEDLRAVARRLLERSEFKRRWEIDEEGLRARAEPVRWRWEVLEGDGTEILVEFAGGHWTKDEVLALLPARLASRPPAEIPRRRLETEVRRHLLAREQIGQLHASGLAERPEVRRELIASRRRELAAAALAHRVQQRLVAPTDAEIRAHFEAHRQDFQRPAHYRLSVIQLPLQEADKRAAYRRGARLLQALADEEQAFEDLAREHSSHPSAATGGDLGWVSRWNLPKRLGIDVLREVLSLEPGETGELVEDNNSLWIVRLDAREAERPMTLAEAYSRVDHRLGNQRVRALERQVSADWLAGLDIRGADEQ